MFKHTGYCLRKTLAVAVAAVLCQCAGLAEQVQAVDIAVLTSDNLTSTQRTLSGAKTVIAGAHPETRFTVFFLDKDPEHHAAAVDSIRNLNPSLILTVGSSATELAQKNFTGIPIVFSSVKYPELSGFVESARRPGRNITGASLDIPVDIQFKYFRRIIPELKRLGVLYTKNTESLIPGAKAIARQMGLELVAVHVQSDRDLPEALDSLIESVEAIWSVADANLFKPTSTRYILLNTVRKGIPFMGFSRYVVESGALCALDFDYKAVGFQAGAIVNRVIAGERPGDIRVTTADVIWFHYNENTAKRIHISIPQELASIAKEVYR
ncbi:MAG: ABC transporter substrate-binding protein [Candidatus Zixiibacteriota bacterium]|nr:MAG: ABC transporter substrate-binding protein [candidate division Zixibacteria bacterium]